jgi:serine/threonine protein kinase
MGEYQPGDRIGDRYEVGEVHRGGMGLVYIVRDRAPGRLARTLALKTLRNEFLRDPTRSARFTTECHLWIRLAPHPNLVRALALEQFDGHPFVVLEFVDGGDLNRWIGTPALDPPRALRFGIQFCLGMEQALRDGLASHRDIKPANLLVTREGILKIADFGLVRLRDEFLAAGIAPDQPIPLEPDEVDEPIQWTDPLDRDQPPPIGRIAPPLDPLATGDFIPPHEPPLSRLTATGWVVGTLPYMAPEQFADAGHVDVRADIYAFGVVLYEMLAATRPFRGKSAAMLRRQHERYAPPSLLTAIPRRYRRHAQPIDDIVQRCLKKNPDDRYPSIAALRDALSRTLNHMSWNPWRYFQ